MISLLLAVCALAGCGGDATPHDAGASGSVLAEIEPDPRHPERDRSAMQDDGCLVKTDDARPIRCVYGDRDGRTTAVLFGDSLAMAYFPALDELAKRRGWRLVTFTKMGCGPVDTPLYSHRRERTYHECAKWRERALRRIETRERPDIVFVTGRMSTPATSHGRVLGPRRSRAALAAGYARVLGRLRAAARRVVAFKDLPRSPRNVPDCVAEHAPRLARCQFRITPANAVGFDRRVADAVPGVTLVDLTPLICPRGRCQAVLGNRLVFRDFDHMTPTFARTLAGPIARALADGR